MKSITEISKPNRTSAAATTGRLFFLEASGGRIHSANADRAYAKASADSTDEHKYIAPDLFTAETPLGTYQGMTDQIVLSRTPGSFRTVLAPRGSSKPEWLPLRK